MSHKAHTHTETFT